ncbi:cysteine--tRNA ligase [Fastidiosipila sanguinis]|uniref:Cysteine--tRNA ligase n=2 Tax=Fastidiosipila sanguinis TaxID=236753 RepID=A0A2S0KNN6_9FIRM|nr:cysteine--tRNA ligase [Fastidiosipila sanguinis]AVM42633.1 cysteine--tRNA ligase [Fastidiosipila sanguinis]
MIIYNTMARKKMELVPLEENLFRIYACGPTVYNYFHLGNARPLVNFDTLRRYLKYKGYKVKFVQNFTDIDDKVINRANAENKSIRELSDFYIQEYFKDADGLNVQRADVHPRATDNIPEMLELIGKLVEKDIAYVANDGVYFAVDKFPAYLKLSGFNKEDLWENVRKEENVESGKKSSSDFVLWKFNKPGEPSWESPWGDGRPGWHLECSAMSQKYLGETFDIHCGGKDLIFPHHENEIAQSEAASGKEFARYWMHNGFITVDNEKMSKSQNNFFLIREIANEYGYMPIRLFLLNSHYRSPINYSIDMIQSSKSAYERIKNCYKNLKYTLDNFKVTEENSESLEEFNHLQKLYQETKEHFERAMDDDLNTADALGAIFELVKEINIVLENPKSSEGLALIFSCLEELTNVIGLSFDEENDIPEEILELVEKRTQAKAEKNYQLADELRDEIVSSGYKLTDTAQGTKVEVDA